MIQSQPGRQSARPTCGDASPPAAENRQHPPRQAPTPALPLAAARCPGDFEVDRRRLPCSAYRHARFRILRRRRRPRNRRRYRLYQEADVVPRRSAAAICHHPGFISLRQAHVILSSRNTSQSARPRRHADSAPAHRRLMQHQASGFIAPWQTAMAGGDRRRSVVMRTRRHRYLHHRLRHRHHSGTHRRSAFSALSAAAISRAHASAAGDVDAGEACIAYRCGASHHIARCMGGDAYADATLTARRRGPV